MSYEDRYYAQSDYDAEQRQIGLEEATIEELIEELERSELNADHRQRLREIAEGE